MLSSLVSLNSRSRYANCCGMRRAWLIMVNLLTITQPLATANQPCQLMK